MKRILYSLLPAAALLLSSCSKIDYVQKLDSFSDNIFFVEDQMTGSTHVSNEGTIKVEGDLASYSYTVKINNVQLAEGFPLASATVSNLQQYYQEKGESEEDKQIALYFFFRQENFTRTDGTLDVTNMRYCYLTGTYWLSFISDGRYNVWSTPRVRNLYATSTRTQSPVSAGFHVEDALKPAYKFTVDVEKSTVTVKATGVKLKQDDNAEHTIEFLTMEWRDIPVAFSSSGYSFLVDELVPIINGEAAPQYKISNLRGEIAFDYEGTKTVTYKILNGNDQNVSVESKFDLYKN